MLFKISSLSLVLYHKRERSTLLFIVHHQPVITTSQCGQVHRYHTAKSKTREFILITILATLRINDLNGKLRINITQESDIEQTTVRVGINPDRRSKYIMTLLTIIDRNIYRRCKNTSVAVSERITQRFNSQSRCHRIENTACRYPCSTPGAASRCSHQCYHRIG